MTSAPIAIDTDRCADVVRTWRRMVAFVEPYPRTVGALVRDLSLDGFGWTPTPIRELIEELGHSAEVLEVAVDAVEAVGFDLRLPRPGTDLATLLVALQRSLDDGLGAAPPTSPTPTRPTATTSTRSISATSRCSGPTAPRSPTSTRVRSATAGSWPPSTPWPTATRITFAG